VKFLVIDADLFPDAESVRAMAEALAGDHEIANVTIGDGMTESDWDALLDRLLGSDLCLVV